MKAVLCAVLVSLIVVSTCRGADKPEKVDDRSRLDGIAVVVENGDLEKAITELQAYVKDYPRDPMAWTILGNVLEDVDRDDQSKKAFETAIAVDPKAYQAVSGLGILHRKRKEYAKAMERYKQAVAIEPKYAQAYSSMVVIALKLRDDRAALGYAEKAFELDKSDPAIASNLAVAHHYNGNTALRDHFTKIAKTLGYKQIDTLKKIYAGELTIRDQ